MKTRVKCQKCGNENEIDIDQALVSQFEQSIRNDLELELQERRTELNEQQEETKLLFQKVSLERENIDDLVNTKVKSQLLQKEDDLKKSIRKQIDDERSLQVQELENELVKKSAQLKEFNGTKAQLVRMQRELEEKETAIVLQKEQEFTERLDQARQSIREQEHQASFLKLREREKVIEDLKVKLDEAKRKSEQFSMQGQGEVLELFLEETLRNTFPSDEILEIKKGAFGADCIQVAKTNTGVEIGRVIWESKNTQSFSNTWISKLKHDNLTSKADVMIIVTVAMPKDISGRFGIKDGVWICTKESIIELSLVLRFGMLKLQSMMMTQKGRESKKELLFDYLTSENFKNTFESILESFKKIQDSHQSEKMKMQRLWKEREKMLEQALAGTVEFYGTIKGISSAIPEVKLLEFAQAS
jgi:hypothetical protein